MFQDAIPVEASRILDGLNPQKTRVRRMYAAFLAHADSAGVVRDLPLCDIGKSVRLDEHSAALCTRELQDLRLIRLDGLTKVWRKPIRLWVVVHMEAEAILRGEV